MLFGLVKKCAKIIYIIPTRKQVKSDPEAFLESGSETRMFSILLLMTPSLKYCSKLKGEYKNSKSGSGTSGEPSLTTLGLSLTTILVPLSLLKKRYGKYRCFFLANCFSYCHIINQLVWLKSRENIENLS